MPMDDRKLDECAWTSDELRHFEQRLQNERKRAVAQMGQFDGVGNNSQEAVTGELTVWRFHMADVGTETFEREQTFLMASREGRLLWHIDDALRRLYRTPERFGRCDECNQKIAFERLDAIPYVPRCVKCKQDWESAPRAGSVREKESEPDDASA